VPAVRIQELSKRFGDVTAVHRVSLEIEAGELFTLLGPSGCGKTTLLRLLAGLESPDEGTIFFGPNRVDGEPPHRRKVGMVFQNYAVFPHMTVAENVAYGLRQRGAVSTELKEAVERALEQVQMADYAHRRPDQLSGGQQQRVALARAIAPRPELLLMDEPLSNLDARLRQAMREEIRRLQRQVGITTVYVTHDQEEALAISDRIAVMDSGILRQVAAPLPLYRYPASQMVAGFVGTCSFLNGSVTPARLSTGGHQFERSAEKPFQGDVRIGLRPEAVKLLPPGWEPPGEVTLPGVVDTETFLGSFMLVKVTLQTGESVTALSTEPPGFFPVGARVVVSFDPRRALLFDAATGEAIR